MPERTLPQNEIPTCVPYNRLKPGDPFNPYRDFFGPSINMSVMVCREMKLATKAIWIFLAHAVYADGWTELGVRQMARLLDLERMNLKRHLAKLQKLGLLRLHHVPGKVHGWQLVYQEIFRTCRPHLAGGKFTSTPGGKITSIEEVKLPPHLYIKDLRDYGRTIQDVGGQQTLNGVASVIPPVRLDQTERTGFSAIAAPKQNHPSSSDRKKPAPQPRDATVTGTARHLQPVTLHALTQLFEHRETKSKPKAQTHALDRTSVKEQTKTADAKPKPPNPNKPIP